MRKTTFLIIALFLALFTARGYAQPTWSGNNSSTPTNYDSLGYSTFNVTWWVNETNITNITQVNITINFTGIPTNYTINRISGDEYNGTYGYQEILGAGTYQWYSCAIDNETNETCTGTWNFTIDKAPTSMRLWLNDSENNKSYNINEIANFTAQLNVSGKTIYLNSSSPNWLNISGTSSISNLTNLSTSGLFVLTAYWDGDDNYSLSNQSYYFDTAPPQYSIISPEASVIYEFNKTYWFNISVSAATINTTLFEFNRTTNYTANGYFGKYWYSLRDLSSGNYTYRWIINNSLNSVNSTGNITLNISKQTPSILLSFNPGTSITYGTSSTANCSKLIGDQSSAVKLYRNSSLINSGTIFAFETATLANGAWNYTCTLDESQNYTSTFTTIFLTVSSGTFTPSGSPSGGTQNQTASGTFTLTSSSSSVALEPNQSKVITLTLSNPSSNDIININLSVSGINSSWYTLDRTSITRLKNTVGVNTSKLTLNIPATAEKKTYTITFTAVGRDPIAGKTITKTTSITLTVASEEAPINVTEETNETTNETAQETLSTQVTEVPSPTGLSINPDDFKNIVLFFGLVAMGLVFIFRSNVTDFLMRGRAITPQVKKEVKQEEKPEVKKPHIFSHIKNKYKALGQHKLVIELKKKEKDKEKV